MNKKVILLITFSISAFYGLSQSFEWITDTVHGYQIPIGQGVYDELVSKEFYGEMEENYQLYQLDAESISNIAALLDDNFKDDLLSVTIVFGAWCSDSREHLPHFYKFIRETDLISEDRITLLGCDRTKNTGNVECRDLKIELVPTFIFYINGVEAGRIIETPTTTMENDIYTILSKKPENN